MAEATTEKAGTVRSVMDTVGKALKFAHDEVVGEDPEKAAERLKREGQQTTIVNPLGSEVATGILGVSRRAEKAIDEALNETAIGGALDKLGPNPK